MLQQGDLRPGLVVEGRRFVQNGEIPGFPDVGAGTGHQPERIVVEPGAHVGVAALGQGLVLMVGAAIGELNGGNVENALPCPLGDQMYEAKQVLATVAESHAAARAAFIIGRAAAHVEGHHALVLVPDIHHPVQLILAAANREAGEQPLPVGPEGVQRRLKLCLSLKGGQQLVRGSLVDDVLRREFLLLRQLRITQPEEQRLFLTGRKRQLQPQRGNGRPAGGNAAEAGPLLHGNRLPPGPEAAQEGVPVRVEAGNRRVDGVERIVIPALPVFRLVVDGRAFELHLADVPVALEVGCVVHGVPEAPFHGAVDGQLLFCSAFIL